MRDGVYSCPLAGGCEEVKRYTEDTKNVGILKKRGVISCGKIDTINNKCDTIYGVSCPFLELFRDKEKDSELLRKIAENAGVKLE